MTSGILSRIKSSHVYTVIASAAVAAILGDAYGYAMSTYPPATEGIMAVLLNFVIPVIFSKVIVMPLVTLLSSKFVFNFSKEDVFGLAMVFLCMHLVIFAIDLVSYTSLSNIMSWTISIIFNVLAYSLIVWFFLKPKNEAKIIDKN